MPAIPPTDAQRVQQRRAFGFVLMSAFLPGSVQTFAGNGALGRFARRVYISASVLLVLAVVGLLLMRGFTTGLLLTPWVSGLLTFLFWLLFAFWVVLLLDAWRLARPLRLAQRGRLAVTVTALLLVFGLGGITNLAASAFTGVANMGEVFRGGGDTRLKEGRYNILLLGADAADSREGLRPDSINVASIDAATGATVIFGLPRNLQRVPFPDGSPLHGLYPDGYACGDGACMLNGIWTLGEDHEALYPGRDAGLEATKEAVSETLGIELNYYAMVDMQGFSSLIDAMGGIRLDISKPIPIGGGSTKISGYIQPGQDVLLDGYHALWFARSRAESNDYERMVRQKCVMSAMVKQLDPVTAALSFVELSEAGRSILRTDIPRGEVMAFAELALKLKDQKIASVNFAPPLIQSADPDFDLIRATVDETLGSPEGQAPQSSASPVEGAPATDSETPTASPQAETTEAAPYTETGDLAAVCSVSS